MAWKFTSAGGQIKSGTSVFDLPLGTILPYTAGAIPAGWLACDGSPVSRTAFSDLFSLIGTTYGTGDGSTTFNLPDFRGRTLVGAGTGVGGGASGTGKPVGGANLTARTLGAWGGAESHTLSAAETGVAIHGHGATGLTFTGNQLPVHSHTPNTGAWVDGSQQAADWSATYGMGSERSFKVYGNIQDQAATAGTPTGTIGGTTANHAGSAASSGHNNVQPFAVVNYIVKATIQRASSAGGTISGANTAVPIGGEIVYYGAAEPASGDWRFPHGQEVLIADYPDAYALFTANGTSFPFGANTNGAGAAGTSHFRLPDARGLVAVTRDAGKGTLTGTDTVGTTGGSQTVALTPTQTPLRTHTHSGTTANDNIDHSHSGTTSTESAAHTHASAGHGYINLGSSAGPPLIATMSAFNFAINSGGTQSANHTHTITTGGRSAFHQHTFTTGNPSVTEANGSAHENMQPHMRVNKLIRLR